MIKAIIFDWGGTLAPSDNKIAATRLRKNFEFDEISFITYFDTYGDDMCDTNEYKNLLSKANKQFNIPIESMIDALNADPPDKVFEMAKKISQNYKTYILSNQLKFRTDYIKKMFDLSFFDASFFSNEIGLKKPSEKIFAFLLQKIHQTAEHCLFIDDNPKNIMVAQNLGFHTILFENLTTLTQELQRLSVNTY